VNNVLQHIRIATFRDRFKEIAGNTRTAISYTFRVQTLLRAFNHGRLIEKYGGRRRTGL